MDKKQNIKKSQALDFRTSNFISVVQKLLPFGTEHEGLSIEKICEIVNQKNNDIEIKTLRQLIKIAQLNQNLINFMLVSCSNLLINNYDEKNTNSKGINTNKVWDIICIVLEKIIIKNNKNNEQITTQIESQARSIIQSVFDDEFVNRVVQIIIGLLLIENYQLKPKQILKYFTEQKNFKQKIIRFQKMKLVDGNNEIMKLYTLVLCLGGVKIDNIILLTTIFQRDIRTKKQLQNNLYKLQKWLMKKNKNNFTFQNILQLLQLIKNPQDLVYFVKKRYQQPSTHKQIAFDIKYETLMPGILSQLCSLSNGEKQSQVSELLSFIIPIFCLETPYLIECILDLYHRQINQKITDSMYKYLEYHYTNSISIKKIKLLLQFIKDQCSLYKQTDNNKEKSLKKLQKLLGLMKIISTQHIQALNIIQFIPTSNISLNNVSLSSQTITFFIEITRYQQKMQIISFDFSKQKLHIRLQLNTKGQHTRREIQVLIQRIKSDNRQFQTLLKQPVAYQNDNVKNQFLFVMNVSSGKLQLSVNSSYFQLPFLGPKSNNVIENIQIGRIKHKKAIKNDEIPSFKGKLKMFYVIQKLNVSNIAYIFPDFTEKKLKHNLSLFLKIFQMQPIIGMSKGQKLFFNLKAAKTQPLFGYNKYSQERYHTKMNYQSSISEVIQDLQSFDMFLFLISQIDSRLGSDGTQLICTIFDIMKFIATNHNSQLLLKWLQSKQNQLLGFSYFLLIIFRNSKNSKQSKQKMVHKFLQFVFCFQQKCSSTISRYQIAEVQIIIKILLNFQIWSSGGKTVQMIILKQVQKRLKKPNVLSVIKTEIKDQHNNLRIQKQKKICLIKKNRSRSRILNGLLMALILYNKIFESKEQNHILNASSSSLDTTITPKSSFGYSGWNTSSFSQFDEDIQYIQHKIAQLIERIVDIPNEDNKLGDEQILIYQIKYIIYSIINHHSNVLKNLQSDNNSQKQVNQFAIHLLLNLINMNIKQQKRYLYFFVKDVSPFYHQQNCLLIALLIQSLPPDQEESFRLILQILKFIISEIKQRGEKYKQQQVARKVCVKFIRQAIRGYQQHKYFQPVYLIHFLSWILTNKYDQKHIKFLIRQIKNHQKNILCLNKLQSLLLNLRPQDLVYLTSDSNFMSVFQTKIPDKIYQKQGMLVANKLFVSLNSYNVHKADEFYNIYLHTCYPYSFTNQSDNLKIHPYQDQTNLLSISQCLSNKPYMKAFKNPNDIQKANKQTLTHFGGTLAHYLLKSQLSIPIIQKLSIEINQSQVQSYYSIQDLVEYFSADYILYKILYSCIHPGKQNNQQIFYKSISFLRKYKSRILKNIQIFNALSPQIDNFKLSISKINCCKFKYQIDVIKKQKLKQQTFELLKKYYVELCHQINQQFIKFKHQQCSMHDLVKDLLQSSSIEVFKSKVSESQDQIEHILNLVKDYSQKDFLWANKYYQVCLNCNQDYIQNLKDEESSIIIKNEIQSQITQMIQTQEEQAQINFKLSQTQWKKIKYKNLHWSQKTVSKSAIFKIDLHQCPNFYHLNIKRTKQNDKRKIFPRRFKQKQEQKKTSYSIKRQFSLRSRDKTTTSNKSEEAQSKSPRKKSTQQTQIKTKNYFFSEYVTQKGVYFGKITYNARLKQIEFKSQYQSKRPTTNEYQLSTSKFHRLSELKIKTIKINESCCVFTRRYILRHTALQIFTKDKSYFFNLFKRKDRDSFIYSLKDIQKIINRKKQFIDREFTIKWQSGQLNNFEYLMWINRYSGRTYNDLSQFPVFPWILSDYHTQNDSYKQSLRKLNLPMGRLNKERYQGYELRMKEGGFSDDQKFLYGTFYSNPTVLYNFFIRLEPFLALHWDHQGQKIDHADRLFSGIQQQYLSATNNTSDVKELTPQFYYWPEFLKNRNQFELGKKQKGGRVDDVVLPAWASSPQEFIFKMRQALESQKVTQNLGYWIDLIFGVKNPKKVALENKNLFHPLMYQMEQLQVDQDRDIFTENWECGEIEVAQLTISQFGQVPQTLFQKPHIKKKGRQKMNLDGCQPSPPVFKGANSILPCTLGGAVITKKNISFVSSLIYEQKSQKQYKLRLQQFPNNGQFNNSSYCIINDKAHIFSQLAGGRLSISQRKTELLNIQLQSLTHVITKDLVLIASARNKLCFFKISNDFTKLIDKQTLSGHQDKIYKIVINEGLDILLSLDSDNLVLVHYLNSTKFLRSFQLELISQEYIKEIRIHDMGYFLFLTTYSRILIYSYVGDLLAETDFVYPNENQWITNVRFMSEYSPYILLSSSKGYIYKVNWLNITKQKKKFPYRQYVLQKDANQQLLHLCSDYKYNDQNLKGKILKPDEQSERQIIDFFILKGLYENTSQKMTYSLMALFKSGHLRVFRQLKILAQNFKNSPLYQKMMSDRKQSS